MDKVWLSPSMRKNKFVIKWRKLILNHTYFFWLTSFCCLYTFVDKEFVMETDTESKPYTTLIRWVFIFNTI